MNELTYTRCGDYYIPDLKLSEQPEAPIGKYGRTLRRCGPAHGGVKAQRVPCGGYLAGRRLSYNG